MKILAKIAIVAEVTLFFTPITLMLLLGLTILPYQIVFLLQSGELVSMIFLLICVAGVSGLAGLVIVLRFIFNPKCSMPVPTTTIFMVVPALVYLLITVIDLIFEPGLMSKGWAALFPAPLLVSIHLLYLARNYFSGVYHGEAEA